MQHLIKHQPSFPLLQVNLAPNEVVIAEAGTMVARSATLTMDVRLNAGARAGFFGKLKALMVALVRKLVGGDTFSHRLGAAGFGWRLRCPAQSFIFP